MNRDNAVVLRNHTVAANACTPNRTAIYTGQYGTRTGVTQTDGLFKNGDSPNFPWLSATGIPTLGNWMRETGYQTHYFGKWRPVCQPNHVRCVRTTSFKLSRYFDPAGAVTQQWEMYDIANDPNEILNLVDVRITPPTVRHDIQGAKREALQQQADRLAALLAKLEARDLAV